MSKNSPVSPKLELADNLNQERDFEVNISIPEFTCVCPRTGLPDFATIEINYVPDKSIVELKSLKNYLHNYRNLGIFHETVTNKILDDFRIACSPRRIEVVGRFNARGGISTNVIVRWPE